MDNESKKKKFEEALDRAFERLMSMDSTEFRVQFAALQNSDVAVLLRHANTTLANELEAEAFEIEIPRSSHDAKLSQATGQFLAVSMRASAASESLPLPVATYGDSYQLTFTSMSGTSVQIISTSESESLPWAA